MKLYNYCGNSRAIDVEPYVMVNKIMHRFVENFELNFSIQSPVKRKLQIHYTNFVVSILTHDRDERCGGDIEICGWKYTTVVAKLRKNCRNSLFNFFFFFLSFSSHP